METVKLVCISCRKINYGDGTWSNPAVKLPSDLVNSLCSDCSHQRFPKFYSDYEPPKDPILNKILNGFFHWNGKIQPD